jgi:hypothetical protein
MTGRMWRELAVKYEIWGSHGDEDVDVGLLVSNVLTPSSVLNMEAVFSSETLNLSLVRTGEL